MAWVGIVDGTVLTIRWMDEPHRPRNMNGESYHAMVRDEIWPEVRQRASHRRWWYMQDGAPAHCTAETIAFLEQKFRNRVISRRSENGVNWPPYSPDLNPLDYFYWGYCMSEVFRQQPESIDALKNIIEEFTAEMSMEILRKSVTNLCKRCRLCIEAGGNHFESYL